LSEIKYHKTSIKVTAIILSAIFPGVGQVYLGRNKKGILFYVLAIVIVIYPVIWILSMIDVILSKNVKENQEDPFSVRKNVVIISFLTAPISLAFLLFLSLENIVKRLHL
jgi:TM2 domain-containing membrane protein YozV